MNFNSFDFVIFFLIVYTIYCCLRSNYKAQNTLLLIASTIFYGYWSLSALFLFFISILLNFVIAEKIQDNREKPARKNLLYICIIFNLVLIGIFKYFNFFSHSLHKIFSLSGIYLDWVTLNILLPLGISFYTFQLMSYVIDVYRGDIKHVNNLFDFALFISFFPQLVAGPIERANDLLHQFNSERTIKAEQVHAGLFLIIWGFFKKVVIADNLSIIANEIFNNYTQYKGAIVIVGILAFTFQIYGDFSGYSDIARGIAKLMGFELTLNFKLPYFALNPSDFWSRWHISLSGWLRDYLYIPLGGNRQGSFNTYRNLFLTMLLGGLWHGAAWNFVLWGAYQGFILIVYRFFDKKSKHQKLQGRKPPWFLTLSQMCLMFLLINIGWVMFRSSSLDQTWSILTNIGLTPSEHSFTFTYELIFFCLPLILVQLCQHFSRDLLIITKLKPFFYIPIYSLFIIWISIFGVRESGEFIYFQF
ncbi:MBOAT family protein [Scytonema sp. UIC 10036]|nr:MBOAT family protein [Scytonema sp. UIC 10036]